MKTTLAKFVSLFVAGASLAACAMGDAPPSEGMARLVFVRGLHYDHLSEKAEISLDNNAASLSLPPNSYAWIDVKAGSHNAAYASLLASDQTCNGARVLPTAQVQPIVLNSQQVKYIRVEYGDAQSFACPNGSGTITATPQRWSDIGQSQAQDIIATASFTHWHSAGDFGTVNH